MINHVNLIFIGGHFNRAKDGFIGALTIEQIHNYRFDLAFIGTVGMNIHDDKVTTYDVEDGLTKKKSWMQVKNVILWQKMKSSIWMGIMFLGI